MTEELIKKKHKQIEQLCLDNNSQIIKIASLWLKKNHFGKSDRYIKKDDDTLKVIDLEKSRQDLKHILFFRKIVNLETLVYYHKEPQNFNDFYLEKFDYYRPESHLPSDEIKLFADYLEKNNKYLSEIYKILKLKKDLQIEYNIFNIIKDFESHRFILKKYIRKLLNHYNIEYNENAINLLFSKFKLTNGDVIDTIELFTYDTFFYGSIKAQFKVSARGNAMGIFTAFFLRAAGYLESDGVNRITNGALPELYDPFTLEKKVVNILVKVFFIANYFPEKIKIYK